MCYVEACKKVKLSLDSHDYMSFVCMRLYVHNCRTPYLGVSVSSALGFLFLDAVLYFVIGWYISEVFPDEGSGVGEVWYFPITRGYYFDIFGNGYTGRRGRDEGLDNSCCFGLWRCLMGGNGKRKQRNNDETKSKSDGSGIDTSGNRGIEKLKDVP